MSDFEYTCLSPRLVLSRYYSTFKNFQCLQTEEQYHRNLNDFFCCYHAMKWCGIESEYVDNMHLRLVITSRPEVVDGFLKEGKIVGTIATGKIFFVYNYNVMNKYVDVRVDHGIPYSGTIMGSGLFEAFAQMLIKEFWEWKLNECDDSKVIKRDGIYRTYLNFPIYWFFIDEKRGN